MTFAFDPRKLSDDQLLNLSRWLADNGQGDSEKARLVRIELAHRRPASARRPANTTRAAIDASSAAALLSLAVLRERLAECEGKDSPECDEIRDEFQRSDHSRINPDEILELIRSYAKLGKYLCYKDITDHYGLRFDRVRHPLAKLLDEICEEQYRKNGIFPTSIIVPKPSVASGQMTSDIIKGFDDLFDRLNTPDQSRGESRIRNEQQRMFSWARGEAAE
ncbi:hypothetical protein EJV46_01680 [Roseococcus sp. SYP-B2431]|uniref:hypothetical protein n=1 Tax=Roseococcus sp. SYP-B2431 TaxID=2496640 RepID=UPI00103B3652|nr:hypothetical protein [Roseococcus sp. SYP-B2431]TCH99413.1 hypothetical protein EJV46_01680 [Roseococcus sp. SYP-B2431]